MFENDQWCVKVNKVHACDQCARVQSECAKTDNLSERDSCVWMCKRWKNVCTHSPDIRKFYGVRVILYIMRPFKEPS